jgi:hypothetical protein
MHERPVAQDLAQIHSHPSNAEDPVPLIEKGWPAVRSDDRCNCDTTKGVEFQDTLYYLRATRSC